MSILLIDSYDSFTYNLKNLVEKASGLPVVTIHNDSLTSDELKGYLDQFVAIIVGPGPGHPSNASDVGIIPTIFDGSLMDKPIPVLGICLGFQSLGLSHGAHVERLSSIKHGQVYKVEHEGDELFNDIPESFDSVRYHSLHVTDLPETLQKIASTKETDGEEIIMAMKHHKNPWYGVQYHPESICSTFGTQLIKNFVQISMEYNSIYRIITQDEEKLAELVSTTRTKPIKSQIPDSYVYQRNAQRVIYEKFDTSRSIVEICDSLDQQRQKFILLNSAARPGTWSIVGIPGDHPIIISHSAGDTTWSTEEPKGMYLGKDCSSIWEYVASRMKSLSRGHLNEENFPFIGGFMGVFSYEDGQHVDVENLPKWQDDGGNPDTRLIFIEECILRNNETGETFITSISENQIRSIERIRSMLEKKHQYAEPSPSIPTSFIHKPDEHTYKANFNRCQDFLSAGDSYELCLTTNTKIGSSKKVNPWEMYKTLTLKNPAPYSAYFNFDDCVLISSSPERFIKWDDETCELRPIKGTVKKTVEMTREKAEEILRTPKEVGENLMIVDLIRHDLFELLNNVEVSRLMQVEEYSTVYQLVSVITGDLKSSEYEGIDVLSRSLPPGSMTGAPKKRSVEILQSIEKSRRGFYSGVCGYWSVDNKADWSVIIRSVYHYKKDFENTNSDNIWRIGAGGAITVLSDCDGEWEELLTKLDSVLQAFDPPTSASTISSRF